MTGEQHAGTPWPRFDSHHSCPKCGQVAFGISSQYQSLWDRILRVCQRCGYRWNELPLDRQVKA